MFPSLKKREVIRVTTRKTARASIKGVKRGIRTTAVAKRKKGRKKKRK